MSENERQSQTLAVINDKLQGAVVTYLSCGWIFNNHIKKSLLLSLPVIFLNRWIFGIVTGKKVDCVMHLQQCGGQTHKVHETTTFLLVTLPNVHRCKKILTGRRSNTLFLIWLLTRSSAIAEGPRDASCRLKSCQLPSNSAETTCTTRPEQIEVMKLEG